MPKERVFEYSSHDDKWYCSVGWDKSGNRDKISVATIASDMPLITNDTNAESNGWHLQLNENETADLIRLLQKAARDTFGRNPW